MATPAKLLIQRTVQRASRGRIVWRGPAGARRVALTFDDGPDALTERYLEVLARLDARATFFVMGHFVERRPDAIAAYRRGGHQVAGHGYWHNRFPRTRPDRLRAQLARMARAIGEQPEGRWIRPPHGDLGPVDVAAMVADGYAIGMWSLDSLDHAAGSPEEIAEACAPSRVQPGEVLLLHEGEARTLAALPRIIEALRGDGYELVTMAELFPRVLG